MKKIISSLALLFIFNACKKSEILVHQEEITSVAANKKPSPPASVNPAIAYRRNYVINPKRTVPAIYVMDAGGGNKTKVYTNYNNTTFQTPDFPTWSPDGTKLCFNLNGTDLYTLSISIVNGIPTGSNATKIADGVAEAGNYRKGVWNPAVGAHEIASVWKQSSNPTNIRIVPANGGTPSTLYTSPGSGYEIDDQISFSPDGSKLAFTERQQSTGIITLKIIERLSGNIVKTTDLSQFFRVTGLDWSNTAGSDVIAFSVWPLCSVDNNGLRKLYKIDMSSSSPAPTLLSNNERDGVSWSPDDMQIVSMGGALVTAICNPETGCCVRYYYGIQLLNINSQNSLTIENNYTINAVNPDWKK